MPDGDIVHSKLSGLYQKPYRILCEGKGDRNECTWIAMEAVMRDIKSKGAVPVLLAKRMGEMLGQAMLAGQNICVNWAALSMEIDRLARQATVPHYVKEQVLRACKSILREFRYNQRANTNNLSEAVVERFFQEVYKSNFEQRIPLTSNHYAGVDNLTITERVEAIRPDMLAEINKLAKKAAADEDVKNLRRSPREHVKEIDLDEDLL
ncbi:hypothetical protein [Microseira sp. BLCC-F43]|jgi:hypothetical protein|uniref:hypothetical protein n=1 Tax=Microseira sp. BLCC-F43 TaxID=3153602 RepID=UPI0035B85059